MLYSIFGELITKKTQFAVIEAGGFGLKILVSERTSKKLPKTGSKTRIFCSLAVKRDGADIYGFLSEKELEIFELLNSVSGIGPKSALDIVGVFNVENFLTAVSSARADVLEKSLGISRKKSERIVLELKDKLKKFKTTGSKDEIIDFDLASRFKELKSALKGLGYRQEEIEKTIKGISFEKSEKLEDQLRSALKILNKK